MTSWDKENSQKAATQHKYIFVTPNQKQKKFKLLSGADKAWTASKTKEELNYIYIPSADVRVMGTKDNVISALKEGGFSDNEIKNLLKTAYTRESHGSTYKEELAKLTTYKTTEAEKTKEKIHYTLADLEWFVDALKDVKEEPSDNGAKANKITPKSKRDIFRALWDKIQGTKKLLDVSLLDSAGGAKIRDAPSIKGGKVQSDTLPLETDNVKNYKKAIEWIFGSTEQHEADIESIKNKLAEKKKPVTKETVKEETVKEAPKREVKKKPMGSPRKAAIPGSKSPGAIHSKGGDNFNPIPALPKK
jgi:hypothetical protein